MDPFERYTQVILKVEKLTAIVRTTNIKLIIFFAVFVRKSLTRTDVRTSQFMTVHENPGTSVEFQFKKTLNYLNVGEKTQGNKNDSSSLIGDDMSHLTFIIIYP